MKSVHGGVTRRRALPALHALAIATASVIAGSTASGAPLAAGDSAFKDHPSVPGTPKYTMGTPAYFTNDNIVGTLTAAFTGDMLGTVKTTVYENPSTGWLTFEYSFYADDRVQEAVARATLGGFWEGVAVLDAGANSDGTSGTGDPMPEWTDGDPLFLTRDPISYSPSIQWRAFGLGSGLGGGDHSSHIWFETDQEIFDEFRVGLIDTASVASGRILAPGAVIPLPMASMLGLAGLGVVGAARRRKPLA